jgi:small-conductance mechanosensitive channel
MHAEWLNWLAIRPWVEIVATVLIALAVHRMVFAIARRVVALTHGVLNQSIVRHAYKPTAWMAPLTALILFLPLIDVPPPLNAPLRHAMGLALIAITAWLLIAMIGVIADLINAKYRVDIEDNLRARQIQTQILVLQRIAVIGVLVVALALMLMTFPSIRHIGTTLFASAGVAGLVAGIAARPALANLIAGLQIAMTEPIRLDDVVIIENEWGRIEEITSTYVVVCIWDLRRMIVPLSYFLEKPFQNWTRRSAALIGTVFLYTDYRVPVTAIRQELHRILEGSDLWDHAAWNLQVTDATEHTMQLRALMSAKDSSATWDLRCQVREQLIVFIQEHYPESLPQTRALLLNDSPQRDAAAQQSPANS